MQIVRRIATTFIRKKNSKLPSFTALVSVLGISFGVAAFLVVVTVFNSFEGELKSILFAANPNLVLYKFPGGIPNAREAMKSIASEIDAPFERMSLFEYNDSLLSKENRTATAILRAIEGEKSANAEELDKSIEPKGALKHLNNEESVLNKTPTGIAPIIVGRGLALKLGAKIGDELSLTSASFGSQSGNRYQKLKIVGLLSVGLAQYDERLALLGFEDGVKLFGAPGTAKGIEIRFKDPSIALQVSQKLQKTTPYTVRAWQEIDKGLFEQIERDGGAIKLIVLIITLVAGFNIIVTLSLSVVDRAKQIAVLRSLGATRQLIVKIFIQLGLILGTVGAFLGLILGLVILKIFSNIDLGELKAFYWLDKVPVHYDPVLMLMAFGVAVLLSFVSALYPAWKATRVSPLFGLKK